MSVASVYLFIEVHEQLLKIRAAINMLKAMLLAIRRDFISSGNVLCCAVLTIFRHLPNGETLRLDVSCFYLPSDTFSYIIPARQAAKIGDTVNLFSRLVYNGDTTFINPALVVYATDSVLVYELLNFKVAQVMNGTSGSPVLNQSGELISNSYAGLTLPGEEEKEKLTKLFPVIARYPLQIGKTYGMGVPVKWIEASLFEAIQLEKVSKK